MSTTITWLGHGAFEIRTAGQSVLIDPFLTDNPTASTTADALQPDAIVVTHGHGDHVGDTIAIAKRTGALVVSNYEIVDWLGRQGVETTHPMHIGGAHRFAFGLLKLTIAPPWIGPARRILRRQSLRCSAEDRRWDDLPRRRHRLVLRHEAHRRRGRRSGDPSHRRQLYNGAGRRAPGRQTDRTENA